MRRTAALLAVAVVAAAGCGTALARGGSAAPRGAGPFRATGASVARALHLRRIGAAASYGTLLRPGFAGRYRARGGTVLDLLVYGSDQVAVRAWPQVRERARHPVVIRHNVIAVLRHRAAGVAHLRRRLTRLGATSSVP